MNLWILPKEINNDFPPNHLSSSPKNKTGRFYISEPFDSVLFCRPKPRYAENVRMKSLKSSSRFKCVLKYIPGAQTQTLSDLRRARTTHCRINTTNLIPSKCQRSLIISSGCWILNVIRLMFLCQPLSLQRLPPERKRKPRVRRRCRRHMRC